MQEQLKYTSFENFLEIKAGVTLDEFIEMLITLPTSLGRASSDKIIYTLKNNNILQKTADNQYYIARLFVDGFTWTHTQQGEKFWNDISMGWTIFQESLPENFPIKELITGLDKIYFIKPDHNIFKKELI